MKCILWRFTFLLSITLFCSIVHAQKKSYSKTLLWRISGNGLQKPSYLFGTMHLEDRRLFMFGDSLYRCLERAEGFAMEVDPDSAMIEMFRVMNEPDTTRLLSETYTKKQLDGIRKSAYEKYGLAPEKITRKQAWILSQEYRAPKKGNDMSTPVDTYLYNIARKQGKWVGGIEDLRDQFDLGAEWGADFTLQGFGSHGNSRKLLDKLIGIYLAQDLDAIYQMTNAMEEDTRDDMLIRRNVKMAWRMDSMARMRSNFFAVGAAHLPGEDGLIDLLERKGFAVEPIFSSKKINPESYSYPAVELDWHEVQDKKKTFTVKMPGKAYPLEVDGGITMETYSDIGTGMIFLATSVETLVQAPSLDTMLARFAKNLTGKNSVIKKDIIDLNGITGLEDLVSNEEYWYRVQGFIRKGRFYMTVSCATRRDFLNNNEANRFHRSLVIQDIPENKNLVGTKGWRSVDMEKLGFEIELPGVPERNEQIETGFSKNPEAKNWNLRCFTLADENADTYYMIHVRETRPGFYIMNDTLLFGQAKAGLESGFVDSVLLYELTTFDGFPAMKLDATYRNNDLVIRSMYVNRGNRSYIVCAIGNRKKDNSQDFDRYFRSFKLTDYPKVEWSFQSSPAKEFSSWSPSAFSIKETNGGTNEISTIVASDTVSGYTFAIDKQPYSKYSWAASDSLFFETYSALYISEEDSVLERRRIQNGAVKGMEYTVASPIMSAIRRFRLLPHGDTLYVVYSIIPAQDIHKPHHEKFFSDFRFADDRVTTNHVTNKTSLILKDLHSQDSATFFAARAGLSSASFTAEDLPLLHQAMQVSLETSFPGSFVNQQIAFEVGGLHHPSTIEFIRNNYLNLSSDQEALRYHWLSTLAKHSTVDAYKLLVELASKRLPTAGNTSLLGSILCDSLQLTAQFFEPLLGLSHDSLFISAVLEVATSLLRDSLTTIDEIRPYSQNFYRHADSEVMRINHGGDFSYETILLVEILARFDDEKATALLQRFVRTPLVDLASTAAIALIENNEHVDAIELQKIAAKPGCRVQLYEAMQKAGKQKLFPEVFASQRSIAEGILYAGLYDDVLPDTKFIGERTFRYKKKLQKFYLFKATYTDDESAYLGIVGPFPVNGNRIITEVEVHGINEDVPFDGKAIEKQLRDYLEKLEKLSSEEITPG